MPNVVWRIFLQKVKAFDGNDLLMGPAEAGLLRLARQFSTLLAKPAGLIRQVVFPDLTRSWNQGDSDFKLIVSRTAMLAGGLGLFFVLAGFGTAVAGALWLAQVSAFQPKTYFSVQWTAYMIFMVLFGVSLTSLALAEQLSEIEPFKTVLILRFVRDWWFVAFALLLIDSNSQFVDGQN